MRHPFAAVTVARPHSFFSISRPTSPEGGPAPLPDKRRPLAAPPLVPPPPSIVPLRNLAPNRILPQGLPTKVDPHGHFVRHSSKLTLLLSGQRPGASMPSYADGDTVEGVLAIARPSGMLALDVQIEGTLDLQEIAGTGSSTVKTIDEKIYCWRAATHGSFPPKASFRYTLPSTYRDARSGKEYPLPPTYCEELHGIPGFTVKVSYAIVVNITLLREASSLWRSVSNVKVPFRYLHRTRPSLLGPFPSNPHHSETRPRTLFVYQMRSGRGKYPSIRVHLYLPSSLVCCYQEPIPFHVTLLADELTLEPFAEYRPMPSSFLPLPTTASTMSFESVQHQRSSRKAAHKCPLRIQVQRTTVVDSGCTAFSFSPFYPRNRAEAVRSLLTNSEEHASLFDPDRSYMYSTQPIGHGVVHSASSGLNSVVWSGAIIIPPAETGFSGGFEANGLQVVDSIVLSIDPPARRSHYSPLDETIPIRLTSHSAKSHTGIPISNVL